VNKKVLAVVAVIFLMIDCALFTIKYSTHPKPKPIHKVKPHYKYSVFLTSDDGPLAGSKYLNQLVLDYEFPLTLFLVGKPVSLDSRLEPNLENYLQNRYLLLGNHSFTHANGRYKRFYKNPDKVEADFIKNEDFLNITSHLARLPGRNVWVLNQELQKGEPNALKAAKKLNSEHNYKVFGWDYELRHKKNGKIIGSAQEHYKKIKKLLKEGKTYTKNQIVILMHDQMFTNDISSKELGELILLLQDDDEIKLKLLDKYTIH